MKYLLLLLVITGVVWWLRQSGRGHTDTSKTAANDHVPQDMVACTHCHVHVPRAEALPGTSGLYCCAEHRQQHEG